MKPLTNCDTVSKEGRSLKVAMQESEWLEILESNQGFSNPEQWVHYARQCHFTKIRAVKLTSCPDCRTPTSRKIGQYVYYSNLINLKLCCSCDLIYADTEIDPEIIQRHFESAYKHDNYFLEWRQGIFNQVADLVDRVAPQGGTVIDVGGAKGHLMAVVTHRRPDLRIIVNDLSSLSCASAKVQYGFETNLGPAADLDRLQRQFDVLTAIDVLYYETNISKFLDSLPRLVTDHGAIIIRVPNNLFLIRLDEFLSGLVMTEKARDLAARIRHFNPEHLYIFSRKYLAKRLKSLGFVHIDFLPSALLITNKKLRFIYALYYRLARIIYVLSLGRIIVSPSFLVVANRH